MNKDRRHGFTHWTAQLTVESLEHSVTMYHDGIMLPK